MGIVRVKFPDRRAVKTFAAALDRKTDFRLVREVERAADRPGLTAQLTIAEALRAEECAGHMTKRCAALARNAAEDARKLDLHERTRARPADQVRDRLRAAGLYSE